MAKRTAVNNKKPSHARPGELRDEDETPEPSNNAPVAHVKCYPVSGSIWRRYTTNGSTMYNASFQRAYKDGKGAWKYTTSFSGTDLLVLAECAQQTYRVIERMRAKDRADDEEQEPRRQQPAADDDVPF